jgi:DNA-binding NtrC family response regulator
VEESALINRLFNQSASSVKGLPEGRSTDSKPNEEDIEFSSSRLDSDPSPQNPRSYSSLAYRERSMDDVKEADDVEEVEEVLSLQDSEKELIRRALVKHGNRRKHAAFELGISERTLYRKIKEYGLK